MITLSVIKADVGGFVGHSRTHPKIISVAKKFLKKSKHLIDYRVMACGDDLQLILTHKKGTDNEKIHELAWNCFLETTEVAKKLKLYGAGQDLLKTSFAGNLKGMGPGFAEMEFEERKSEPVIIFMADKTEPGAWNMPLYKMFADPFNTAGLVIDPLMHQGFIFEVMDTEENKSVMLSAPEELYDLLVLIGETGRYVIKRIYRKADNEVAVSTSTSRLSLLAGKYVGKDDPVCVVRAQFGLPAVGEVLEPFAFPHLVQGWMRGSHNGPLMPVSFEDAVCSRFDGPPRVIAAGFQLANGKLEGPVDMLRDPAFDNTRQYANKIADYLRRHGPFEPHRLSRIEMEYTTLPGILKELDTSFINTYSQTKMQKLLATKLKKDILTKLEERFKKE